MKKVSCAIIIALLSFHLGCGSSDDGSSTTSTLPVFSLIRAADVGSGILWAGLGYDGSSIAVTTETPGDGIYIRKYDTALTRLTDAVRVAGVADTQGGDTIADHKHIFQNGFHFIAFSTSGGGQGGYLYLMKLDTSFNRIAITTVAASDPPTNDMLMVGDGSHIYVGKFKPGVGHHLYKFDSDLALEWNKDIGGDANTHANGAGAVYANNRFYLVSPQTLAPGEADHFYLIEFDDDWNVVRDRRSILFDPGMLSIVSAVSYEPQSNTFIVHYARMSSDAGGPLYRLVYDSSWNLLENTMVLNGSWTRPHSLIIGNTLYVGYDGGGVEIAQFSFTIP